MPNRLTFMERMSERITALESVLKKLEPVENILERMDLLEKSIYSTKRVFTFQDACMYIGVSDSMLYKLTANKEIPHYKPRGKMIYFAKEELDEWLLQNHEPTADDAIRMATETANDTTILKTKTLWKTKEGLIITQVQDLRNISCWIFLPLPRSGLLIPMKRPRKSFG